MRNLLIGIGFLCAATVTALAFDNPYGDSQNGARYDSIYCLLTGCSTTGRTSLAGGALVANVDGGITSAALDTRYVNVTGDQMTGPLSVDGGLSAQTLTVNGLEYVRGALSVDGGFSAQSAQINGTLILSEESAPAAAVGAQARIYCDSTSHTCKISLPDAGYYDLLDTNSGCAKTGCTLTGQLAFNGVLNDIVASGTNESLTLAGNGNGKVVSATGLVGSKLAEFDGGVNIAGAANMRGGSTVNAFAWTAGAANSGTTYTQTTSDSNFLFPFVIRNDTSNGLVMTWGTTYQFIQVAAFYLLLGSASIPVKVSSGFGCGTTAQTVTGADDGNGGTAAAVTFTPSSCEAHGTCNDAQGCTVTMSETGAFTGEEVKFINVGASNDFTFADAVGVQAVSGASITIGPGDNVRLCYTNARWDQCSTVQVLASF